MTCELSHLEGNSHPTWWWNASWTWAFRSFEWASSTTDELNRCVWWVHLVGVSGRYDWWVRLMCVQCLHWLLIMGVHAPWHTHISHNIHLSLKLVHLSGTQSIFLFVSLLGQSYLLSKGEYLKHKSEYILANKFLPNTLFSHTASRCRVKTTCWWLNVLLSLSPG
jgi:hypothetical protein